MSSEPSIEVATWNLEWASPSSPRGQKISALLRDSDPDILCLTEAHASNFPDTYHVIEADPDYGYPMKPGRRKVLLGSKSRWSDVDTVGDTSLPGGRFVAGITETELGQVRVIGVCIPWKDAHVRTGRRDRAPWSDHRAFLSRLQPVIGSPTTIPVVVLGDFNQTLPRSRQPADLAEALENCLAHLSLLTRDFRLDGRLAIDHIALDARLVGAVAGVFPAFLQGQKLSDHFGVVGEVRAAPKLSTD